MDALPEPTRRSVSLTRLATLSSRSRSALAFRWAWMLKFEGCLLCCAFPFWSPGGPLMSAFTSLAWPPAVARFPVVLLLIRPLALSVIEGILLLEMLLEMPESLLAAVVGLEVAPKSHGCLGLLVAGVFVSEIAVLFDAIDGLLIPKGTPDLCARRDTSNLSKLLKALSVLQQDRKSSRTDLVLRYSSVSNDSDMSLVDLLPASSDGLCGPTLELTRATSFVFDLSHSAI